MKSGGGEGILIADGTVLEKQKEKPSVRFFDPKTYAPIKLEKVLDDTLALKDAKGRSA
jgi:hypothetical protein